MKIIRAIVLILMGATLSWDKKNGWVLGTKIHPLNILWYALFLGYLVYWVGVKG